MSVTDDRDSHRVTSVHVLLGVLIAGVAVQGVLRAYVHSNPRLQVATTIFVSIFVQAIPFVALGTVVSGAIAAFVSPGVLRKVLPRNEVAAVGVASVAGMALPGCECGAVPVSRRLVEKGAPVAAAVAFLLAAPAINPVVLVSTIVAFPGEPAIVVSRFCGSVLTAVCMGLIWSRFGRAEWIVARARARLHTHETDSRWETFVEAIRHDLLQSGAFLVVGAAASALLHLYVPASFYDSLARHLVLSIASMALLAVVLALCSEADAFVAASMSALPLLPRLVFLVVGPAVDVKLFAMQVGTFGPRFAIRFAPTTLLVAVACATVVGSIALGGVR